MLGVLKRKTNDNRGFTLIELIVVIAIIGILMLLAVPRLLGYTETARERADDQLRAMYGNTFQVLLGSGDLRLAGTTGTAAEIVINAAGTPTVTASTGYTLMSRNGTTAVIPGPASPDDWAPNAVTVTAIQARFISAGGGAGAAVPTFQSRAYAGGITITVAPGDIVTVTPRPTP